MRHIDPDHLAPEMPGPHDQAARHHAVVQDLLIVIDVVDEEIERLDALLQPRSIIDHSSAGIRRGIRSNGKMRSVPCSESE